MKNILEFDEFLRSLRQNRNSKHSILIGAGASIESGLPSAMDCIWEWKKQLFISNNPTLTAAYANIKNDIARKNIQQWLDNQTGYPEINSDMEYSFYVEKAYPIPSDRRKYFENLAIDKEASIGYHLLMMLAEKEMIKSVWTTNFDGLVIKTAHNYNLVPIEITLESQDRIFRNDSDKELSCVMLHGDYKYGPLKNTELELDCQSDVFSHAFTYESSKRNFFVIGYSGRDKSLMDVLKKSYSEPGSGRLYWCGYGRNIPSNVQELIEIANLNGREVFYIPTDGFDTTLLNIARMCWDDDLDFQNRIHQLTETLQKFTKDNAISFRVGNGNYNKILQTNVYPIAFPKNCFRFKVLFDKDQEPWKYCKELMQYNIMAVPHEGMIYSWGNRNAIVSICGGKLIGNVDIVPLSRENFINNSAFLELLKRTIVHIISRKTEFPCWNGGVWNPNAKFNMKIGQKNIEAFEAIEISLFFDNRYSYITFNPSYKYADRRNVSRDEHREFSRLYSLRICGGKPNVQYYQYIDKWLRGIFNDCEIKQTYPLESNNETPFTFTIGKSNLSIGVNAKYGEKIPKDYNINRVQLTGEEVKDTELVFYNSNDRNLKTDFHPMRGLTNNGPYDTAINVYGSKKQISLAGIVPIKHKKKLLDFIISLNQQHRTKYNVDYVIDYPGFCQAFGVGLTIPEEDSKSWLSVEIDRKSSLLESAVSYADKINRSIDEIHSRGQVDVILIYVPKEYESINSVKGENYKFDFHDYVKAYAVQKHVSTQFIREETVDDRDMICQIAWAISLAIYVKSGRVPWVLSNLRKDTAFAGIGYSLNHNKDGNQILVGCSHIYSSDGQGLRYKLTKINDVFFDEAKQNPYLSESEAYQLGVGIKDLFYSSFSELPKRVVVHKRTPFKSEEISGIVKCLSSSGIKEIDLIEINYEESVRCFALDKEFKLDGFPVKRGTCFAVNGNTAYLYTHGIATSVRNPNFKYIQGGKSIPAPIKIVKHYGTGDLSQIASEILGLSKMSWNSFGLYTKLPCTIESSNQIAKIGWMLSGYEGAIYEYRHFM